MSLNLLHRKERLILTTIDIIEELGIQKLTTREIAKRQEVSEATIFRHFQNKNELLMAVLDYFTQYDADIAETVRMRELKPLQALKFLVDSYAEYYENYPAITSLLQLFDVFRYEPELAERIKIIQESRTAMLKHLIDAAIDDEKISRDTDSYMLAVIITGLIREQCFNWRLNHYGFSLRERVNAMLDMILNAFCKEINN
jgi:AcrR family transcriptional regulator